MRDMTKGAPLQHLLFYAVPLLFGNWLQLAYNAADSVIAGRFIGQDALAAEGIASPVMNLVILAISGLCIGAGVLMSEAYGAKQPDRLRSILGTTLTFGSLLCVAVALLGVAVTPWLLRLLAAPPEIADITGIYLRITFLGAPFTFFYNALAAGLKSAGDSKTPLKFLAFSAVLNAVLDLIFIGGLGFGIVCSAVTTVVAEGVSALLALVYMLRRVPELCPQGKQWRIAPALLGPIMQYGAVTALQQAVQPVCKLLIQGQVNALGVQAIAAFNAATRVDDFAFTPEQSIAAAITTYIAQNRGAGQGQRIRSGFAAGLRLELGYWVLVGSVTWFLRRPMIALFVAGQGADDVVRQGAGYLGYMAVLYALPALTNGFQGFYRGMGKMTTTLLGTCTQAGLRALFAALLAPRVGLSGIAAACAVGWTAMLLFEVPYYFYTCRKQGIG
ncbi:MATE family efflux transporter [uncultured Gemmiger sp.]|uniref:MATE family efflux transporter n=1 Tax=uncultured Gemmiger sp. TaxID=1623490 RepID=UPI0025FDA8F1|nr:MATE family efflux transporter [uncultured Gemmiger sp.]